MYRAQQSPRVRVFLEVLAASCAFVFAPVAALVIAAAAFVLAPVGIIGIPFLLWAFFGSARAERRAERQRSIAPAPRGHLELAR